MAAVRKLVYLGLGLLALQGVQACVTETELNPQPLPPEDSANRDPESGSAKDDGSQATGGMGGSSGSSGATPSGDAGADAKDAADGGDG